MSSELLWIARLKASTQEVAWPTISSGRGTWHIIWHQQGVNESESVDLSLRVCRSRKNSRHDTPHSDADADTAAYHGMLLQLTHSSTRYPSQPLVPFSQVCQPSCRPLLRRLSSLPRLLLLLFPLPPPTLLSALHSTFAPAMQPRKSCLALLVGVLCLYLFCSTVAEASPPSTAPATSAGVRPTTLLHGRLGRQLLAMRAPSSFHVLQVITPCQAAMNAQQYYQWLDSAGQLEAALQAGDAATIRVQCSQVAPKLYATFQSLLAGVCSQPTSSDQSVVQTVQTIIDAENAACSQEGQGFASGSTDGGGALSAGGVFVSWDSTGCSVFDDCYQQQVWVTLAVLETILGLAVFGLLLHLSRRRAQETLTNSTCAEYRRVQLVRASIEAYSWLGEYGRSLDVNGRCIAVSVAIMLLLGPPLLVAGVAQPYCVGWLLAFVATLTPLQWLYGAAVKLQMRELQLNVVRALKAALGVVVVAGVLSCMAGVYATLLEAVCNAATPVPGLDQICFGDGATRSVHAVYDVQFICFWLYLLDIALSVWAASHMYYINQVAAAQPQQPAAVEPGIQAAAEPKHVAGDNNTDKTVEMSVVEGDDAYKA